MKILLVSYYPLPYTGEFGRLYHYSKNLLKTWDILSMYSAILLIQPNIEL